ncbi:MAG: hypothetical protein ACLFO2_02410 [Candidatus Woesearchaeota archaeon]
MKNTLSKTILVTFLVLFTISAAHALEADVEAINNTVPPLESATYQVTLTSDSAENDVINIKADSGDWIVTPRSVSLAANETKTFDLLITPRSNVGLSNYRVPLAFIGSRSGDRIDTSVFLSVSLELFDKGYPPNVKLQVDAPNQVDPREPMPVSIFLRNNNLREFEDLVITAESDLFSEEVEAPLESLSTYRKKLLFNLDPEQEPGTHVLEVEVALPTDGTVIARDESTFEIKAYARLLTDRAMTEKGFLTSTETITLTNDGNEELTKEVTYEVGLWEDLFLTTSEEGVVVRDGERKIAWTVTLEPQETREIVVERNYYPLAAVILAIILAIIGYFVLRSPIVAVKEAHVTHKDQEGMNEMKVRVFVKNRSKRQVNRLKVIDRVPRIAEFITSAHLGTLQPSKVTKSERRGTIARWEIDSLEPYEERIISYKIKSKLKIVGKMVLPPAKIKFHGRTNRERVVTSGLTKMGR